MTYSFWKQDIILNGTVFLWRIIVGNCYDLSCFPFSNNFDSESFFPLTFLWCYLSKRPGHSFFLMGLTFLTWVVCLNFDFCSGFIWISVLYFCLLCGIIFWPFHCNFPSHLHRCWRTYHLTSKDSWPSSIWYLGSQLGLHFPAFFASGRIVSLVLTECEWKWYVSIPEEVRKQTCLLYWLYSFDVWMEKTQC